MSKKIKIITIFMTFMFTITGCSDNIVSDTSNSVDNINENNITDSIDEESLDEIQDEIQEELDENQESEESEESEEIGESQEIEETEEIDESDVSVTSDITTPQVEESTPQVEEVTPQVEEVTPQVEEVTPQVEEVVPKVEEVTPKVEEVVPQVEETTPEVEKTTIDLNQYANEVIELVNKERAKEGLSPLTYNSSLSSAAFLRADEIVGTFSHTRPNGSDFYTSLQNYTYSAVGENIASGQANPTAVMTGWMNSTGHRENILTPDYTEIGVGVYEKNNKIYWVQIFGTPRASSSTPSVDSSTPSVDSSTPQVEEPTVVDLNQYANEVIEIVNQERAKEGLSALKYNSSLSSSAFLRADELVETFSHTRPDGSSFTSSLSNYSYSYVGENIAAGQANPTAVMTSWMNSTGHRENILKSDFTEIGVGVYEKNNKIYWVQIFGNPR